MNLCPYCEQDDLWSAKIRGLDQSVIICDECDTVWQLDEPIQDGTGTNFEEFMKRLGKPADWKLLHQKTRI